MLIIKPKEQHLPTALRAAFINSVEYGAPGSVLATQFHAGRVIEIHMADKTFSPVLDGLTRPHGGMLYDDGMIATDTAGGAVVHKTAEAVTRFDFTALPGKSDDTKDLEWLQTSHLNDKVIITIDSNRTAFVFFDPQNKKYMTVPFDPNWAVQDFIVMDDPQPALIKKINQYFDK